VGIGLQIAVLLKIGGTSPHLTVADRDAANAAVAAAALDARLQTDGAIASTCRRVTLLEDSSGVWREVRSFELAPVEIGVG